MAACIRALGGKAGQQTLARLGGTTEDGSTEEALTRAMLAKGYVPEVFNKSTSLAARNWLTVKLKLGYPVVLCVERWEHWVACLGMLGARYIVFDPARFEYRVNTGVTILPWENLARYWYANKKVRGSHGSYYGLAVLPQRR